MSSYITRWCQYHDEWDMDVDNVDECPKCIELELTEVQQLRNQVTELTKRHDDLFEMDRKIIGELNNELTNLKEAFARLREDRDMHSEMRQENRKAELRLLDEKLEVERQMEYLNAKKIGLRT